MAEAGIVKEWLVCVRRDARGRHLSRVFSHPKVPEVVTRPVSPLVVSSEPRVSVGVLATEAAADRLRRFLGLDFTVQPLALGALVS